MISNAELILILQQRWVSKEELQDLLETTERGARQVIADLNEELKAYNSCVLSTSRKSGYHIPSALSETDVQTANVILEELKNKAISIFERRSSIENFIKYAASAKEGENHIQGELF